MHTIIIIINLNACCWDFMRQTYFVLKYLFSLCHFLAFVFCAALANFPSPSLSLSLFVSPSLSFSISYDMLWELFSLVALFQWNKHRLSHAFKHFNNCILLVYIHLNLLLERRAHCHTFLVFAHFVVKTSLRIQSDVEQINSVHRCVSPIQWQILEFETQRELSLSLSRPFAFSIRFFFFYFRFFMHSASVHSSLSIALCVLDMILQLNTRSFSFGNVRIFLLNSKVICLFEKQDIQQCDEAI